MFSTKQNITHKKYMTEYYHRPTTTNSYIFMYSSEINVVPNKQLSTTRLHNKLDRQTINESSHLLESNFSLGSLSYPCLRQGSIQASRQYSFIDPYSTLTNSGFKDSGPRIFFSITTHPHLVFAL